MKRGFTITELLIVITIVGVLMTLGAVSLRSSQVSARDTERKMDIEAIALQLEDFYTRGSGSLLAGEYPSTLITSNGMTSIRSYLPDIHVNSLKAPGVSSDLGSFEVATVATENTSAFVARINKYVYQPLQANGALCTALAHECTRFNLYYTLESTNTVQMLKSRHR
jgi:prepilin-type N-terminal cleavage/methylation domain-containing protein